MQDQDIPDEHDEHWERLARYLADESPPEEAAELEAWLAEDPDRQELLARLRAVAASLVHQPPADLDVEAALARVHQRIDAEQVHDIGAARTARQSERRPLWRNRAFQLAAAVVLLLGANLLVQRFQSPQPAVAPVASRTYETPVAQADTIQLADGSTVVLAPASRLVVGEGYGGTSRSVVLQGVAWFNVRHDAQRAFTVHAGDAVVTDLGTAFTVRADPAQPVSVAVTEGSVRLASNTVSSASVILEAGQRGTLSGNAAVASGGVTEDAALAWTQRRLVFVDAPFEQVAVELHRWFGVTLVAGDRVVAGRHLTSEFEGESLSDVLAVLALALDARTEVRGDTVVVRTVP